MTLGDEIKRRLGQLRARRRDVASAAQVEPTAFDRLIDGRTKRLRDSAAEERLERALGWLPGSFDDIRHGESPGAFGERIDWPRESGTYGDAVEQAWARLEAEWDASDKAMAEAEAERTPNPYEAVAVSPEDPWAHHRPDLRRLLGSEGAEATRTWPLWLTDRLLRALEAPGARASSDSQLAGEVVGLAYLVDVMTVLQHRARPAAPDTPRPPGYTEAMNRDLDRIQRRAADQAQRERK